MYCLLKKKEIASPPPRKKKKKNNSEKLEQWPMFRRGDYSRLTFELIRTNGKALDQHVFLQLKP